MKIVTGIPTLNRFDLLKESLLDLSKNFANNPALLSIHIVDNGRQIKHEEQFSTFPVPLHGIIYYDAQKKNIGVAASWNKIIKRAFDELGADYVLLLNDDVVLGKSLNLIIDTIKSRSYPTILTSHFHWSVFLLSKDCYETIGLFDEIFYPAYYEDNDYARRISLKPEIAKRWGQDIRLDPVIKRNSMTIKKDPQINKNFSLNQEKYIKKWGGMPDKEKYKTPYNL